MVRFAAACFFFSSSPHTHSSSAHSAQSDAGRSGQVFLSVTSQATPLSLHMRKKTSGRNEPRFRLNTSHVFLRFGNTDCRNIDTIGYGGIRGGNCALIGRLVRTRTEVTESGHFSRLWSSSSVLNDGSCGDCAPGGRSGTDSRTCGVIGYGGIRGGSCGLIGYGGTGGRKLGSDWLDSKVLRSVILSRLYASHRKESLRNESLRHKPDWLSLVQSLVRSCSAAGSSNAGRSKSRAR